MELEGLSKGKVEAENALQRANARSQVLEGDMSSYGSQTKQQYEEIARLEGLLDSLGRQLKAAESEVDKTRLDLSKKGSEIERLQKERDELRALTSSLDGEIRRLSARGTRMANAVNDAELEVSRCKEELSEHRELIIEKDNQIASLLENAARKDSEFDNLRLRIHSLESDLQMAGNSRAQLQQQLKQLRELVKECETRLSESQAELSTALRSVRDAEVREASAKQESQTLRQALSQRITELSAASADLQLMTRENQALTSELASASGQHEQFRKRIGELTAALSSQEQQRLSLEAERQDLLQAYRNALQDKRRLEADLKKIGVAHQEGILRERRCDEEKGILVGQIDAYRIAEKRWLGERATLSAQIEGLNDTSVRLARREEAAQAESRRLSEDVRELRQTNKVLHERIALILKRAAAAADNARMLGSRLAAAENERDALRATIGSERQRAIELEQVAMAARSQVALAYTRERVSLEKFYSHSAFEELDKVDIEGANPTSSVFHGKMEAVYGISSPSSSDSQDVPTSLPTTATAHPNNPQSYSPRELTAALGLDDSEPDSLDAFNLEAT